MPLFFFGQFVADGLPQEMAKCPVCSVSIPGCRILSTHVFCALHFDKLTELGLEEDELYSPALSSIAVAVKENLQSKSVTLNFCGEPEIKEAVADIQLRNDDLVKRAVLDQKPPTKAPLRKPRVYNFAPLFTFDPVVPPPLKPIIGFHK